LASATFSTATQSAKTLANEAINNSNKVVEDFPNSMPFWKTRTRVFYQLASIDPKFAFEALAAIQKAADLAPTDAKVHYNLGILLGRTNQIKAAEQVLEDTIAMKVDYRDAYYALGLYYQQEKNLPKAREQMELILKRIGPDKDAQKWLDENK
jgi:tetratricopeptide (TPR) repeat protein